MPPCGSDAYRAFVPVASQKASRRRLVAHQEIEHAGKEARIVDGVADLGRLDARQRQETPRTCRARLPAMPRTAIAVSCGVCG